MDGGIYGVDSLACQGIGQENVLIPVFFKIGSGILASRSAVGVEPVAVLSEVAAPCRAAGGSPGNVDIETHLQRIGRGGAE